MRRRRMIVGYEIAPTLLARMLPSIAPPECRETERWCAACRDGREFDDLLVKLVPLYRTAKLEGRCVECGIELSELASALT